MRHLKTTLAIGIIIMALTSCKKTYRCVCDRRPGVMNISNAPAYSIKARNTAQAIKKCDEKDTDGYDCWLE
jgi:hypothetical protein